MDHITVRLDIPAVIVLSPEVCLIWRLLACSCTQPYIAGMQASAYLSLGQSHPTPFLWTRGSTVVSDSNLLSDESMILVDCVGGGSKESTPCENLWVQSWSQGTAEAESNRCPSVYQPALAVGRQAGSQIIITVHCCTFYRLTAISLNRLTNTGLPISI